jgi:putative ABC transport system substrate-binding protein
MNRRGALRWLIALGAARLPSARAQARKIPVIGYLNESSAAATRANMAAFRQGLAEAGFVDGRDVTIEYRWAEGRYDRLSALAADLVRANVSMIATGGGPRSATAAKAATAGIPIVFTLGVDPVETGLVASFNRPGGNVTGATMFTTVLTAKRLELIRELVPDLRRIAFLVNPDNPNAEPQIRELGAAARASAQELQVLKAGADRDFDSASGELAKSRVGALIVSADPYLGSQPERVVALAARHAIPAIYPWRTFPESGGLISYGTSLADAYRQSGIYAGRILKGAKPSDLPVVQPSRFELVVNLKAAKALRLKVPRSILLRADEVIE